MRQPLGIGRDDAQAAAAVGVDDHALRRGDRDLRAAAPQLLHDLLGIVEDLDGGDDALVLQVALVLGEPQRDVEHGARHDGGEPIGPSSSGRQACLSRFMSDVCTINNEFRGSNGPPRHMGYNVTLKPSGHRFEVKEGQSVLQAGLDAGFMMPYSCRTGVCRTCRGTVRGGSVDYGAVHPTYLPDSDKAKGFALLCQARPLSDLVVEVRELEGMAGIRPRVVPRRLEKLERPAPDVALMGLRLPMNENFRFLAGQYVD